MAALHPLLSHATRADLFAQLAALERAGVPAQQAFAGLSRLLGPRCEPMLRQLRTGGTIAAAGERCGVFAPFEARLVGVACHAGSPAKVYAQLAEWHRQRDAQFRALRSRLAMPVLVLALALLIRPLPGLVTGELSVAAWLWGMLWPLGLLAGLAAALRELWRGRQQGRYRGVDEVLLQLPVFADWLPRLALRDYAQHLALLTDAGIGVHEASPLAMATVSSPVLAARMAVVQRALLAGEPLAAALAKVRGLPVQELVALVDTGEQSGRLPEMLAHYAAQMTAALEHEIAQLMAWLPRLLYAAVALWMAFGILSGGSLITPVPADLQ
ncbi:type II secretion system F family protein [Chitinilyticum piscinae]|uniref:Type II secretion system F family protein n=1 Tax=Chitinilyticum piscinae TaxID=2866724 RepID=A0A8J7FY63_9NEIS|nr:type II secretion system F family protein [Chitinilyticum piscinae]MBE9607868.1 type II secretion system F family protein [Chitinilyticum piscinae]